MSGHPRKVVIAVDPSGQAETAFLWYLEAIHRDDNEVVLLFVEDINNPEKNDDGSLKKISTMEDKYNGWILERGISGRMRTEKTGSAKKGEVICRVVEEEEASMVVLGTRGLGKVRRTIMGSVSDYVVHHATCPVIVCRQ